MAKTKSKNDIKITNIKKNSVVVKKGAKTTTVTRKLRQPKKKLEVVDEVKKEEIKETEIVKKPAKKKAPTQRTNVIKNNKAKEIVDKPKVLTQEEVIKERKERNRKKYQNQQRKYQESKKNKEKKKIVVEDQVDEKLKKSDTVKEEDLVKKVKQEETKEKEIEKERKEKRKTNRKSINFTQTITNIKDISVTKINNVKDKVDDKYIPVGKTRDEKVKRSRRFIKEAIVYAIILTIIDVVCILIFDYFNFLRLFDVKALNIVVTILIALIFNFFVTFMVDYFVTGVWLNNKRKKKVGEQDGNSRIIEEEHRENIENKEGE